MDLIGEYEAAEREDYLDPDAGKKKRKEGLEMKSPNVKSYPELVCLTGIWVQVVLSLLGPRCR
jgi:hypothetical protein